MTDYKALIDRLTHADGPDNELDALIAAAVEPSRFDAPGLPRIRPIPTFSVDYSAGGIRFEGGGLLGFHCFPEVTKSIDEAVALCKRVLPGWGYRVATCSVSDDAWVIPDFNCPEHGQRLQRELRTDIDWAEITDVDLRPAGREPIALCISILLALHNTGAPNVRH